MTWDWNDLRFFLAVARAGTTLGAARTLDVNQTTCARRIASLEKALDATLFERTAAGYMLTDVGKSLLESAERAEAGAVDFEKNAIELTRASRRVIRFTTSDILANLFALPAIQSFAIVQPDVHVALDVDRRELDLNAGEADIALRPASQFADDSLVARKVLEDSWAFYCAVNYPNPPTSLLQVPAHPLATMMGRPHEMLLRAPVKLNIRYSMNDMARLIDTIAAGDCIGALPRVAGDRSAKLRACVDIHLEQRGIWIVYPARLRKERHITAFAEHLAAYIKSPGSGPG